jgi:hypothetical protein
MIRKFKFYKEEDNKWFVDLPEWEGEKEDLEMVLGADILLEILSGESDYCFVTFADEPFEDAKVLSYDYNESSAGYYNNDAWHGPSTIWLCYVTEFVFGKYPEKIYYK